MIHDETVLAKLTEISNVIIGKILRSLINYVCIQDPQCGTQRACSYTLHKQPVFFRNIKLKQVYMR